MKHIYILILLVGLAGCGQSDGSFDATGNFEAVETIISSEAGGRILQLNLEEGDQLTAGQRIGFVDSTQLHLTKLQLIESQKAVLAGRPNVNAQMESTKKEIESARIDQKRLQNLVKAEVANKKQLDDVDARLAVLEARLAALQNSLTTSVTNLNQQSSAISVQLASVADQLKKCQIINPTNGTVLTKYAMVNEMVVMGRPLYKIADLTTLNLRAYVTGNQFATLKLNQQVRVFVDDGNDKYREYAGEIIWINDKAEFTPKTIQTKDERANLVYATKIRVKNDGLLKWGMYGEVKFK